VDNSAASQGPNPAAHRWGPDRRLRWVCLAVAVGCLAWRLIDHDPENRLVAATLTVAGLIGMLILIRMRVRLSADTHGLTITGPLRARTVAWTDIETIATPRRGRFGRRRASLEIDVRRGEYDDTAADGPHPAADTELLAFGAFELGTDPAAVGRALTRLRP
jgi:hypothetical protein